MDEVKDSAELRERKLIELQKAQLLDETKRVRREQEEAERAETLASSPECQRDGCSHKLVFHDPCSICGCEAFVA